MMQGGFIFGGDTGVSSPAELARKRQIVDALVQSSISRAPQTFGEGLTAIGQAIAGRIANKQLTAKEEAERSRISGITGALMGGQIGAQGGGMAAPSIDPMSPRGIGDDALRAIGKQPITTPQESYQDAIASIESAGSGGYAAVGPQHPTLGRALGKYQVMEANIGPWSREVLGQEVTPEQFMADPALQDAIFNGKFGQYVDKFGPEGAAQAWFAGEGGVGQLGRKDSLGTTVGDYSAKFMGALGDVAGNPYATPAQQQMAQTYIQQAMTPPDPMADIELQKAQLELDRMQEPDQGQPLPAGAAELDWRAREAGLQRGTPEYQEFILNGGSAPSAFRALEMQAEAAGLQKGTPEFEEFMATRGAGQIATAKAQAEADAKARAELGKVMAQGEQAVALIDQIADDPALASITGMVQGNIPAGTPIIGGGQAGIDLNVKIQQLQGKAFLEAFEALKGGGAITEIEGTKAEQAMARLNRAQSKEAYVAALNELKQVIQNGMIRAEAKAGRAAPMPSLAPAAPQRLKFNPATGAFE